MMGNKMLSTFHKYDWFRPPFGIFCCFTRALAKVSERLSLKLFVYSERSEKQPIARFDWCSVVDGDQDMSPRPTRLQNPCWKLGREG